MPGAARRRHFPARLAPGLALVVGACSGPASYPPRPATMAVTMVDYRFRHQRSLPAGRVVFRVYNAGHLDHDLNLVRLPEDLPPLDVQLHAPDRRVLPTVAGLSERRPGGRGAFAVDLAAGRYGLVCFVEDADGVVHAQKGMDSEFRVR